MKTTELSSLSSSTVRTYAVTLPGVILAFDPADDPSHQLSGLISANPGMPVVILCTKFDQRVFSLAENTNRTFVLSLAYTSAADVPAGAPVSMVAPGDMLPALPGDVSVVGTATGFSVTKCGTGERVCYSADTGI